MEKLQPVLKQIFWICFGLAVLLLIIGWWMASGSLSTAIAERQAAVDKAYTAAKQNVSAVPNSNWTTGATVENAAHEKDFEASATTLYSKQLDARVYPKSIRGELNNLKFNSRIDDKALRERFAQLYDSYFNEQLKVIKPFLHGKGLVDVSQLQVTRVNSSVWSNRRPTSEEIWNAQEDIWLIRSLLDSIARVNRGADRIDKATLRKLDLVQLRGGDRDAEPGGGGGAAGGLGGFGEGGGEGYGGEGGGGMLGFGSGRGGGGGGAAGGGPWKSYEGSVTSDLLTEELGADAGGGMGGMGGMGSGSSEGYGGSDEYDGGMGGGMPGSLAGFGAGGGGGASSEPASRYVDDDEELPYRTRAFQLKVHMVQTDIPVLLAELTNSSFPVEIIRVDAMFKSGETGGAMGAGGSFMGGEDYEGGSGMESGMTGAPGFGGSAPGFGGGAPGFGGSAPGFGGSAPGFGGGSLGGSSGMPGGMSGMPGMPGGNRLGTDAGNAVSNEQRVMGQRLLTAAMADPAIAVVRVAGLMTVYRSREENQAEAEAKSAAESESQESGGVDMSQPIQAEPETPEGENETSESPATDGEGSEDAVGMPPADAQSEGLPSDASPVVPDGGSSAPAADGATPQPGAGKEPDETSAPQNGQ